jgi:[ribosomal protein S5]-alanine N-acetyltransferase
MLNPDFSPFPQLVTKRLILRQLNESDAEDLLFLRSDENVMEFIDREKTKSVEEALAFIQNINRAAEQNESILWGIALLEQPDTLIGTICIWNIQKEHYRAEVGYLLHPQHWRKGFMKEALLAVIDFGFNSVKLHSLEARIHPQNAASAAVLEKTGFIREAYFREDYFFRGKFGDTAVYSLLSNS